MPRLDQIEHSADRAFLLKARIYLPIRGKDSPDLFTRTVDGLFRLKPQRTTKAVMAAELANEILHFQSLGITNVTLSYADGLGRAGGRLLVSSSSGMQTVGFLGIPNLLWVGQAAGEFVEPLKPGDDAFKEERQSKNCSSPSRRRMSLSVKID